MAKCGLTTSYHGLVAQKSEISRRPEDSTLTLKIRRNPDAVLVLKHVQIAMATVLKCSADDMISAKRTWLTVATYS